MLTIYLAGPIRDNKEEDIIWREEVISYLNGKATFLNPLAAKTYNPLTGVWNVAGILPTAKFIFEHDLNCVRRADIVLANLTALTEYPGIGTLVEIGHAHALGKLIYIILDREFRGHENEAMFTLHPFLKELAAVKFDNVMQAAAFLDKYLPALDGGNPRYGGFYNG